ncbi:MAG TPA: alpha-L-arabinofuranosidase C-terminal domain-containing protein [Puia sp.]|nr:alpha-L-arabinofuranosidase C-terminal domain-containing protein [Puia sp.]
MTYKKIWQVAFFIISPLFSFCQETYTVNTKVIKGDISPTLWGLFFEDINRGADGGLYGEMVENRSFDFPKPMMGWTAWPNKIRDGIFMVVNQSAENPANPKYMAIATRIDDTVGLINAGFGGMRFEKDGDYQLTLRYRQQTPGMHVRVILFNTINKVIARTELTPSTETGSWMEKTISVKPTDTASVGKVLVIFEGAGKMDVDRISLFPPHTWKERPGGLRADLVQRLADLHPGFLRFPGGCIVEGNNLSHRYQWKHTIGPIDERQLVQSIWNDDVPDRQTPDYFESFGLGFYEYFQLCEDIGASPLPILNCGMSCQFDAAEVVPINELDPYIQDALDLIEFANGEASTKWGAKRAALGHPAPFNMHLLGVGNENWGPQYAERLDLFTRAIKTKYPTVQLINATGYSRNEPVFKYMDSVLRNRQADIIDEHFYSTPEWFLVNSNRYDGYDRKGPKIFVGEYAAQSDRIGSMKNVNNLKTALSEAAFMTGIERNADVVTMASYAPLFGHVRDWQWTPNLIWFDNAKSYNTPNYYIQQLFALYKGTSAVSLSLNGKPLNGQDSIWASAVIDKTSGDLIVKLVNMSATPKEKQINLSDAKLTGTAEITSLHNSDLSLMNSLASPDNIAPVSNTQPVSGKQLKLNLSAYSFTVVKVKLKSS